jgi:hypothetical protein
MGVPAGASGSGSSFSSTTGADGDSKTGSGALDSSLEEIGDLDLGMRMFDNLNDLDVSDMHT